MWEDLFRAMALMMIIEGMMPFLSPGLMRDAMSRMLAMDNRALRIAGLFSMLFGLGVLYAI